MNLYIYMYENRLKFYILTCEQWLPLGKGGEGRSRVKRVLLHLTLYFWIFVRTHPQTTCSFLTGGNSKTTVLLFIPFQWEQLNTFGNNLLSKLILLFLEGLKRAYHVLQGHQPSTMNHVQDIKWLGPSPGSPLENICIHSPIPAHWQRQCFPKALC